MKKHIVTFLMLIFIVSSLCGCGATEDSADEGAKETGYQFLVSGVQLGTDINMEDVLSKLGEPKSTFTAPSCAGQGISYIYDFGSYEVETYPDGEVNKIAFITLKDDTVATEEGVDLSMTKENVVQAYGEDYVQNGNGMVYTKNGMKLQFLFDGDDMTAIEYVSSAVG